LGERLLKPEFDFDKEIRVLELLKLRFGDGPLQACEVMLKDVQDSRRTDAFVKREQSLQHSEPTLSAKILSRLFWPSLHAETFKPPPEIAALQSRYAAGFESFKTSRKLTWLPALGQVSIELQLADRLVAADVHTWQASVIHAFQAPETAGISRTDDEPVTKTVAQLAAALEMDTPLVANALTFWVGKSVLAQTGPDAYTVLERLAGTDTPATTSAATADGPSQASLAAAAASAAAASTVASAVRSEAEVANEQMEVFWQYIVGMLTNQGAMPLARIVMMLNLVVPGGFSYGQEELRAYLERRIGEGKVELVGGSYRVVKEKA
jgi:anaphase-promoting complex subunit 2